MKKPPRSKSTRERIKGIIGITLSLAIIMAIGYLFFENESNNERPQADTQEYIVSIANIIGHKTYYCTTYTRDGNVYKLLNRNGDFIVEIALTDGYTIEITSIDILPALKTRGLLG